MSDFTPGPWRVDDVGVGFEIAAGNEVVAQAQQVYGDHNHKIRRGNARLIAAAPDLLEFVAEWLSSQGNDKNYMTEKARAAIAKATGDQP